MRSHRGWPIYVSQRTVFQRGFSPSIFPWVPGMEVRLPALHSKHLYPLSQLSRSQRTISSKTLHIFSPPTTKHGCGISSVVDMHWRSSDEGISLLPLTVKYCNDEQVPCSVIIRDTSSCRGWEQTQRPTAGTLSPKRLSSPIPPLRAQETIRKRKKSVLLSEDWKIWSHLLSWKRSIPILPF